MDKKTVQRLLDQLEAIRLGESVGLEFAHADLRGAFLLRAVLSGGDFTSARFEGANLSGAKCLTAHMKRAQFRGANLNGADFTSANLRGADFSDARVEGASFCQADLCAANLARMQGMPSSVAGMRIDSTTVKRSELTDEQVIEYFHNGATLVDLKHMSERVRLCCGEEEQEQKPRSVRRRVALEELETRSDRVGWLIKLTQQAIAEAKGAAGPDSMPRSFVLLRPGDRYLGMALGARLPAVGPVQKFDVLSEDGLRLVAKLYDPSQDKTGLGAAAFRRGVRNLGRITLSEVEAKVPIPRLMAVGCDELGYVFEPAKNGFLPELLALCWTRDRMLEFFRQLAELVQAVHDLGLIVRCLCPSTIMLGDEIEPILADLDAISLVGAGDQLGAELSIYGAPEELLEAGAFSPTADVFSLGKLLYFLLTGQTPPEGGMGREALEVPQGLHPGLMRIISKATQTEPRARYQYVTEMLDDLGRYGKVDEVGCQNPLADEAVQLSSVPPAPLRMSIGAYPSLSAALRVERPMPRWAGPLGVLGLALAGVAVGLGTAMPVPSPRSAGILGLLLAVGLGLFALIVPWPRRPPLRIRVMLGVLIALGLFALEPGRLSILRWRATLAKGDPENKLVALGYLIGEGSRDLRGCNLAGLRLTRRDLLGVDFSGCDLRNTDLSYSTLAEAKFAHARLEGADLTGASLFRAEVAEAEGFFSTKCSLRTRMPENTRCENGKPRAADEKARTADEKARAADEKARTADEKARAADEKP